MSDDIRRTVGANVRAEMARRGVTQRQVAEALGISQPQISKRLAGRIAFDVVELQVIGRMLGLPAHAFLPNGLRAA